MKKLLLLLVAVAAMVAAGCGGNGGNGDDTSPTSPPPPSSPPPTPTPYMVVQGDYQCTVVETVNTCNHNGAREQLPSTLLMHIDQDTSGMPSKDVFISLPPGLYYSENGNINNQEFHLGGELATNGTFVRSNVQGVVTTISYSSIFEGADGVANYSRTTSPYFLEIDYVGADTEGNICQNGQPGQAILTLDCPKM